MALTPTELYDAAALLWERDAGFRPSRGASPVAFQIDPELAAILIRDRIVERLGELGFSCSRGPELPSGEHCVSFHHRNWSKVKETRGADRTLALIAAAMKATEPARVG